MMDFEGIEKVRERVQNGQTLLNVVNQLSQELASLKAMLGVGMDGGMGVPAAPNVPMGRTMGQAQKAAQTANMTSYGQRLAQRAAPNMNAQ
jgi:hypothetical protein